RLAARGYDILIAARNAAALERQAQLIRDRHHVDVRVLVADLAQPQGLQKLEDVLQSDQSIALLVNNAGLGSASGFLQADLARMEEMIA
ncbi:SDR family NAD(P)-dependent oxidoreductase, partial [Acinetobacter baumannii]